MWTCSVFFTLPEISNFWRRRIDIDGGLDLRIGIGLRDQFCFFAPDGCRHGQRAVRRAIAEACAPSPALRRERSWRHVDH